MPQSGGPNHDPARARLITRDIPNFWCVFDQASLTNAAELLQRDYFDAGTTGLHDFLASRIQNARLLAAVAARPRYYAAILSNTLALDSPGTFNCSLERGKVSSRYARARLLDGQRVTRMSPASCTRSS